jgi:hypothetical protein
MQKLFNSLKKKVSLYLVTLALLTSCGVFASPPTPTPTEPPGPADWTRCRDSDDPNIYQPIGSDTLSSYIYQSVLLQGSSPLMFDPNKLSDAKLGAYLRLANSVRNWTYSADIPVRIGNTGNAFVRFSLTFISPELIEWVLLNQSLGDAPISKEEFINRVNAKIGYFENRKEMVFLVIFASSYRNSSISDSNAVKINANVGEIKLFETGGNLIEKSYSDPPLGQDRYVSREFLSGYIAYPMFVHRNKKCTAILNRELATSMTLRAEKIFVNGTETDPIILSIRYHPLLDSENHQPPDPMPIPDDNFLREPGVETAPPNPVGEANNENALYWQHMASYIWWYLASP